MTRRAVMALGLCIVALALLLSCSRPTAHLVDMPQATVSVNGKQFASTVPAIRVDGQVMVPVRQFAEALGGRVSEQGTGLDVAVADRKSAVAYDKAVSSLRASVSQALNQYTSAIAPDSEHANPVKALAGAAAAHSGLEAAVASFAQVDGPSDSGTVRAVALQWAQTQALCYWAFEQSWMQGPTQSPYWLQVARDLMMRAVSYESTLNSVWQQWRTSDGL